MNVLGYLVADRLGTLEAMPAEFEGGTLIGEVHSSDGPAANVNVLVAGRTGHPYIGRTDSNGRYRIEGIPPGQYVPIAVGPGYAESRPGDALGIPRLVSIRPNAVTPATPIRVEPYEPAPLPASRLTTRNLESTAIYSATSVFPAGAVARVEAFRFEHDGAEVDTLRLYLPDAETFQEPLPLLLILYPGEVDGWQSVSVALADQGYAVVALSPLTARGLDIDAHARDARMALEFATRGLLGPQIDRDRIFTLGGSFTSAVLHRLLRSEGKRFAGWITLGGISNAFTGAESFYAGDLQLPQRFELLIPALGSPQLYPYDFLRYSPVYTAGELPPSLIIHTAADRIIPIEQAYELEEAARAAGVPVEVYYYEDISHYLQIDENISEAGKEMFYRVIDFVERHSPAE